jgi:tRNA(Ile)-lysidine synthase
MTRRLYHVAVHALAKKLLAHIRREELLSGGDRVGIAVSGGIDSVALLRLILELRGELGIVLTVVHFNHKLRGVESDADEEFVAGLAREHGLEFYVDCADMAAQAAAMHGNMEAAAREARYGYFQRLLDGASAAEAAITDGRVNRSAESAAPPKITPAFKIDKIATGHTLDDQAETVLMRLIRGTGMRGLGGIHPRILVERDEHQRENGTHGEIIRPLLGIRRRELEKYLKEIHQPWREDPTNADVSFTRNRVRKIVLPLLEREFNPAISANLVELAEIARGEEDYWENEVSGWMGTVVQWSRPKWAIELERAHSLVQIQSTKEGSSQDAHDELHLADESLTAADASINRAWLLTEPVAAQRRLIRAIGEHARIPLEFHQVEEILRFAGEGPSGKELMLPRGWKLLREPDAIVFHPPDPRSHERQTNDYEYELSIPGQTILPEAGITIEALRVPAKSQGVYNPQQLLRAELRSARLRVRNWRPGDRFWPAHTKAPKKIKELLQELHVPLAERKLWPVVLCGEEIVWVRGFPVPQRLRAGPEEEAVMIRELDGDDEDQDAG